MMRGRAHGEKESAGREADWEPSGGHRLPSVSERLSVKLQVRPGPRRPEEGPAPLASPAC